MPKSINKSEENNPIAFEEFKQEVLQDFKIAVISREISLLGRKEVLTGKAKFGIFGDGKELPQIALAKAFQKGDWRSGYYRDQTWMLALGELTIEQFFAQLFANPDQTQEPFSAGRQMNAHFATKLQNEAGEWLDQTQLFNSTADASPTACQMPRSLGVALASKLYRNNPDLQSKNNFSNAGNEVSFVSIGDASTSEGHFWETVNAAAVMQVPLAISVWDDGYGISVPKKYQTAKESISEVLAGFQSNGSDTGIDIYVCEAWNYPKLVQTYEEGIRKIRQTHRPALFHIIEVTQPQGHSTSGSHERYKSDQRLAFEKSHDCILQFREWIISNKISSEDELASIESDIKNYCLEQKKAAWQNFNAPIKTEISEAITLMNAVIAETDESNNLSSIVSKLQSTIDPLRRDILKACKSFIFDCRFNTSTVLDELKVWTTNFENSYQHIYSSHLYSESPLSALKVKHEAASFDESSPSINGYEILNQYFDHLFESNPNVVAFGEDLGKIGDVNQGFAGLQEKYSDGRIFDTGIREITIMGQGYGLSLRGLRPIAEIQYLDYLLYGLQPLSDDVATLQYRTKGIQKAPMIVRTRGHRLEGIWHTGSPLGMIINSLRGMHVCVPRNMVQAAGMYNTLLQSDEPGLVIECLNGYRLKEKRPNNLSSFTVLFGLPEVILEGDDITVVSYGSTLRIIESAIEQLANIGISVELIDVQTLLPFDLTAVIGKSIRKTNRVLFIDEDVPGGASAYMLQQVLEHQNIFQYLDSPPATLSAKAHRAAYGSDGDYFSKPNEEEVFETIYKIMSEVDPDSFPAL
jgi:pyruvate/2-oxoglutarate/acetoin dehydrogenase E1 component/TPP-dependent pyruvate/acetoin dehydrogenase alpha subunit